MKRILSKYYLFYFLTLDLNAVPLLHSNSVNVNHIENWNNVWKLKIETKFTMKFTLMVKALFGAAFNKVVMCFWPDKGIRFINVHIFSVIVKMKFFLKSILFEIFENRILQKQYTSDNKI